MVSIPLTHLKIKKERNKMNDTTMKENKSEIALEKFALEAHTLNGSMKKYLSNFNEVERDLNKAKDNLLKVSEKFTAHHHLIYDTANQAKADIKDNILSSADELAIKVQGATKEVLNDNILSIKEELEQVKNIVQDMKQLKEQLILDNTRKTYTFLGVFGFAFILMCWLFNNNLKKDAQYITYGKYMHENVLINKNVTDGLQNYLLSFAKKKKQ